MRKTSGADVIDQQRTQDTSWSNIIHIINSVSIQPTYTVDIIAYLLRHNLLV